jgi:hypothetical protein
MTDVERQRLRETAAQGYEDAAAELERAVLHLRHAASLFREGDVPRGCAHAWAAHGHVHDARQRMDANAVHHASRAQV